MYALTSLLMVRYHYAEHQLVPLERWLQGVIWFFALGTAIFPIPLGLFNNVFQVCWFSAYPAGCQETWQYGEENATCTRGDNAGLYGIIFTVFPIWTCIFAGIVIMCLMFLSVRNVEKRVSRYAGSVTVTPTPSSKRTSASHTGNANAQQSQTSCEMSINNPTTYHQVNRQRSRAVARQAIFYISAFVLTYSLDLVNGMFWYTSGTYIPPLDVCAYILLPLQGLFNFMIFSSSRQTMKTPEGRLLRQMLFSSCCCCCGFCHKKLSVSDSKTSQATVTQSRKATTAVSEAYSHAEDHDNPPKV
mmetsp:Transcript_28260/g.53092  ORF Transcript_28260/g.53092 Transcript_28260/m.53092 type:complete len:302 (-) Transcript_28260:113-1018(-)